MTAPESTALGSRLLSHLSLPQLCGQLIVVGFESTNLPDELAADLAAGLRGGVILFRRNTPTVASTWTTCCRVLAACDPQLPPLIAVDQEGGRVSRLPEPIRTLPSMRTLASIEDVSLIERAAETVARGLVALGFNCNFAPVLDVDSNPLNPVIGDRSFSNDPHQVARCGLAFARGLNRGGVLACGKHFPGHGDTLHDSHVQLPRVERSLDELERTELLPFQEAAAQPIDALMTAHVVYSALDPSAPATLSSTIITALLRDRWGYQGLVISDDLEMGAIRQNYSLQSSAIEAIRAGCDLVLVCHSTQAASQVLDALVNEAECSPEFCDRVYESARRSLLARRRCPPRPAPQLAEVEDILLGASAQQVFDEICRRTPADTQEQ
jgi:beta-N-acetylhexosaminidase